MKCKNAHLKSELIRIMYDFTNLLEIQLFNIMDIAYPCILFSLLKIAIMSKTKVGVIPS